MHSRGPELRKFLAPEVVFGVGSLHLAGQYGRNLGGSKASEACLADAQRLTHTGSWPYTGRAPAYWFEENFRIWGFDPQLGPPSCDMVVQRMHPEDRDRVIEFGRARNWWGK